MSCMIHKGHISLSKHALFVGADWPVSVSAIVGICADNVVLISCTTKRVNVYFVWQTSLPQNDEKWRD